LLFAGAAGNTLQGNTATLNILWIWLDPGATSNTIQGSSALDDREWDLADQNSSYDSNRWSGNRFVTDYVVGVPDSGPNAGCIR
jgi:hypothetical protein